MTPEREAEIRTEVELVASELLGQFLIEPCRELLAEVDRLRAERDELRGMARVAKRRCATCDGEGYYPSPGNPDPEGRCQSCGGLGYYLVTQPDPPGETVAEIVRQRDELRAVLVPFAGCCEESDTRELAAANRAPCGHCAGCIAAALLTRTEGQS